MAKIIDSKLAYSSVLNIIEEANDYIVLISPFLKFLGDTIINELKDKRGVHKVIICRDLLDGGKSSSESIAQQTNIINELKTIDDCEVHICPNLHAKCYFNEHRMVITSMNLYDSTIMKNLEMGIRLDKRLEEDEPLVIQAYRIVNEICKACNMAPVNPGDKHIGISANKAGMGYCIRCGAPIPIANSLDPKEFFCEKHYKSWKRYADVHFDETFCHICGEPDSELEDRCAAKPICVHCWPKVKNSYKK